LVDTSSSSTNGQRSHPNRVMVSGSGLLVNSMAVTWGLVGAK
jgi:hypothetical protein